VYCQVDYICGCIPIHIQHTLAELPETLDKTYERTLREVNKPNRNFAHRLFQFVAVASRPLRVKELAQLLAFDFDAGPIPKFDEGWQLEDPVDAVLSTCSSLLAIVDGGHYYFGDVIQFSHFSVKEFLTSTRLAEASDIILRRFHISMAPAHTLAAQACLGILLHLDKDVVTRDSLEEFPLARYAAEHWADHARMEDVSRNVEDGTKQLFDPTKSHLAVCIWIHDPDGPLLKGNPRTKRPLPPRRTPLHYAAFWGLHSIVESLVIKDPKGVHSRGFTDNATPLHLASEKGHVKVAQFLLEHKADVTVQDKYGETPLHRVSQSGPMKLAGTLIERGADVKARDKYGFTPLHVASQWGHAEVAGLLIDRGADATARDKYGDTPLHVASQRGQVEVTGLLIMRGADVTAQNKYGSTPLHLALQWGRVEVTDMLIERGTDVTARDKYGSTLLHLASQSGRVGIVGILIKGGADVTARNEDGETPLHLASKWGQVEVAVMLVKHGADVTAQNKDGSTPLHMALQWGRVEMVDMLIERGADVTAQDKYGSTLLHLASQSGQVEIAGILIDGGADVTARNEDGETPLHLASIWGQVEVVLMLVKHGADVKAQNKGGSTPLHLVSTESYSTRRSPQRYAEVARILLDHGTDMMTVQDKAGMTPFYLASSGWGVAEVAQVLLRHRVGPGIHENTS
jgi:ankyrin repeat protein